MMASMFIVKSTTTCCLRKPLELTASRRKSILLYRSPGIPLRRQERTLLVLVLTFRCVFLLWEAPWKTSMLQQSLEYFTTSIGRAMRCVSSLTWHDEQRWDSIFVIISALIRSNVRMTISSLVISM